MNDNPLIRFRELLVEEIRPMVSGLGIVRGDLKARGTWQDGRLHVTVHDAGCREDLHVSSLAVGEAWSGRVLEGLQAALDQVGRQPIEEVEA